MSEAEPTTRISDNVNQGYIAGRDLYLGDQVVVQETLFFEPDLQDVKPPAWTTTPKAEDLARALERDRLIVLAGQDLDDKNMVARHLAWLLCRKLSGEVRVREWYRSSDPQKIESAFHETATTILLLPQVLPHHIGHRLHHLQRLMQTRRNYTVITTEGTRSEWGIRDGSPEDGLWYEISWESYYGRAFLAERLLEELKAQDGRLPEWLPGELHSGSPLAQEITVEEIAARLRQPDRIRGFVQWLRTEDASPRKLVAQLDQLNGDDAAIFQWYRQLDRADQLLALGLVLFDGLPDDQIFAALEFLIGEAWRRSDPNLPLFDYKDLERLRAYFRLAESGEEGTRIETSSSQKREAILQAAWSLQRRRLLAVVPALRRLLQLLSQQAPEAPQNPAADAKAAPASQEWRFTGGAERELFSSPRRVEQLQRSIIEALSRIGLLSFEAVESSFLELAVDGSGFQTVVAKALAAWRGEGHSQKLFKVLLAWWESGCVASPARSLAQRTNVGGGDPWTAMRATVALAVGYALQYDQPNQLPPELLSLLSELVHDRHPAVRARVLELTLPLATASHLRQLEPLLRNQIIGDQDHLYAIAFGTAMAYALRPAEVLEIIERWHAFCRAQSSAETTDVAGTPRDRLLSAVALVYGYIQVDAVEPLLAPHQIVSALRSILAEETSPFIRTHALMAMGLQAVEHFDLVASTLMELISEITLPDRLHVVSVLTRAYLRQREQLENGEDEIEIGGRTFQVWTRSPRPLTRIETSLYAWLQDEDHPVVQQVAIQTFAAIAATELDQNERAVASRRKPPTAPPIPPAVTRIAPNPPRLRKLGLLGRLVVFSVLPRQKEMRTRLLPVLAEAVEVKRTERLRVFEEVAAAASRGTGEEPAARVAASRQPLSLLPMVLKRWQAIEAAGMKNLAGRLAVALDIFRWRWAILLSVAISCGLLYHDVVDWRWALGSSMSMDDSRTIHERRSAPLRLALNLTLPELHRIQEQRRLAEERRLEAEQAEARRRAEAELRWAVAPQRYVEPEEEEVVVAEVEKQEEEPPKPVLTPMDRLRRSAFLMLARLPESELLWILTNLGALQEQARLQAEAQKALAAAAKEAAVVPQGPPVREPSRPRVLQAERPPDTQDSPPEAIAEAAPSPAPAVQVPEESVIDEQPREEREIQPPQEPQSMRSVWKKLRGRLQKKKPPTGDGDGNR